MYFVEWQDKNGNRMDLILIGLNRVFIKLLTNYTTEERDLSQAYSILFTFPPICVIYNQRIKVVENVGQKTATLL